MVSKISRAFTENSFIGDNQNITGAIQSNLQSIVIYQECHAISPPNNYCETSSSRIPADTSLDEPRNYDKSTNID